ncbi:hypothetical protein CMO92_02120 [Candidatus Woesearchaeota archaeon]|mgnify:CR=1 FL=1|nr:hypothetical protein [Candidatus Woesearchaeota archaeon]
MIVQEDFLKKIREFGLNSYEAKLWTALLSRGISTAGELSDIANVPRSRSYDVFESLEKKGFIMVKVGKPIKYIAVPPEEVLERVKKRIAAEAEEKERTMDNLKDSSVLQELTTLHEQGIEKVDPFDLTGSIKGRTNLHNHLDSKIKSAKESVLLVTTADGIKRKASSLKRALKKAKENGVSIKIVASGIEESAKEVQDLKKFAQVKLVPNLDARFCLVDNDDLTFMLASDQDVHPSYDTAVWVKTGYFSKALEDMFSKAWK